jgi:hypothetical protein
MKTILAIAAGVCAAGIFTTSAMADPIVVAKLKAALTSASKPIAGSAVFICQGDTCTASNPSTGTNSTPACRELVREVGQVESFGSDRRMLTADELARCNAAARK